MTKCRAQTVDALAAETPGGRPQAGNVARTCRHFSISRKTFYKWRQRFEAHGGGGVADRARAPHHSPRATPAEVVSKTSTFGSITTLVRARLPTISSGFTGYRWPVPRTPHSASPWDESPHNQKHRRHAQRWTRYEKAQPGHRLQVDEVSRADTWHASALLPIHRDRRLHAGPRLEGLRHLQSADGHRIHR